MSKLLFSIELNDESNVGSKFRWKKEFINGKETWVLRIEHPSNLLEKKIIYAEISTDISDIELVRFTKSRYGIVADKQIYIWKWVYVLVGKYVCMARY